MKRSKGVKAMGLKKYHTWDEIGMDQETLMVIAVLVAIGAISWYRNTKKTVMDFVTSQDNMTTKICIQMALQMLGSALEPHNAKSPAHAIAAGERALEDAVLAVQS